jgi:hypothetical protein
MASEASHQGTNSFNLGSRNSTSFHKRISETFKKIKSLKDDTLRYHQKLVHEYLLKYPEIRGLLAYHIMGAGKTILAASVAESMLENDLGYSVLFLASKSLHANFKGDLIKYRKLQNKETTDDYIKQNYSFISSNASNMIQQVYRSVEKEGEDLFSDPIEGDELLSTKEYKQELKQLDTMGNLEDTFIIVDEVHNLLNSITNGSKNAMALYHMIMKAKRIKLLFLSGSPVVNDPFELAICFNMLAGYSGRSQKPLFGDDYESFHKYFIEDYRKVESLDADVRQIRITVKNGSKFSNRIAGLVSYYGADNPAIKKLFPTKKEPIVERIPMSLKQYAAYVAARDKELEESQSKARFKSKKQPLQKPKGAGSSYRVRSRQFSNFLYPEYASRFYKDAQGYDRYEKFIDKLDDKSLKGKELEVYSPKIAKLLENISKEKGPGIVYSQFIDSGVGLIGRILTANGWKEVKEFGDAIDKKVKKYAIISGDVDPEDRVDILKLFNSKDNINGNIITVLLITATGAEGINTKRVRHVHILEPYWHWARIAQVIARAVRAKSHVDLPPKDQTVQPYIYLSDYPKATKNMSHLKKQKELEETTDVHLYVKALQNQRLIDKFLYILKTTSVDCLAHSTKPAECRICAPTDEPLFLDNLDADIKVPSPCKPLREKTINAKSVVIKDDLGVKKEYMYTKAKGDVHIFEFDSSLNGYVEIDENHDDYDTLRKRIKN